MLDLVPQGIGAARAVASSVDSRTASSL
jgi:hypothetical protein